MNIGLSVLSIYTICVLIISYIASKKDDKTISTFATGGGLGVFLLTLTFSATYHSSYAFMGAAGFCYTNGVGWWVNGIWTVFPGVLLWIVGRRFWYLGKTKGYSSLGQALEGIYDSKAVGLLITIAGLVFTVPYLAMQAIGSGYIFRTVSEGKLDFTVGVILFFTVMVIEVWLGGMRSVALTDAIQGIFMWCSMVFASYFIIRKTYGSVSAAYEAIYAFSPDLLSLPGPNGVVTWGDWVSRAVVNTLGAMMFPQITLRFFAGKSLRTLKSASIFSSIYLTTIFVFTPAIAMSGHLLIPDLSAADTVFPELLMKYLPQGLAALIISGALAATMSTGDSQLHASSVLIASDVYKKYIKKEANTSQQYRVARISVIILGFASIIFALYNPGLLSDLMTLSTGGLSVLLPASIGAIFWSKASKIGAIASIVCGEITMIVCTFIVKNLFGFYAGFWAFAVSLIVFVVISLFSNSNNKTISDTVNDLNQYYQ